MKNNKLNVEEYTATLIPYAVQQVLSSAVLEGYDGMRDRLTVDSWLDPVLRGMVIQLRTAIAGKDQQQTQKTFRWPETWWDAFKLKYAPSWFLASHPIKYHVETVVTQIIHTCPHISTNQPRNHLKWLVYGYDDTSQDSVQRNNESR